jgi:glycosyltransferase involved in cell wall biosynthesis
LSSIVYQKKKQLYNTPNISFITSSVSLHDTAKSSSLLGNKKVTAIPIPINKKQFYSIEKNIARKKLNINSDKKIILFGVHNIAEKRKGFQYFLEAINQLWDSNEQFRNTTEVALFGKSKEDIQEQFKIKVHILGTLNAQQIFNAYNAADVYVLPSLEDNLPNTILESLACETPVVAFKTGGIPEMIQHKQNGFLAEYKSSESLAEGIDWVLSNNINAAISDIYGSDYAVKKTLAYYNTILNK